MAATGTCTMQTVVNNDTCNSIHVIQGTQQRNTDSSSCLVFLLALQLVPNGRYLRGQGVAC
jgi:hypothetical protein